MKHSDCNVQTSSPHPSYPWLDLLKYLCSVGIIAQHTQAFRELPRAQAWFERFQPTLVALFFVIASVLFWQRIRWNETDRERLWHYVCRLLTLVCCWGLLLAPHWLPKFIRHNPDNWMLLLGLKALVQGFAQGSWFIMSLIYGILLCYLANRYLNRHFTFVLVMTMGLYFSLVHYEAWPDWLHLYWPAEGDQFQLETYYSPLRSLVWIEGGFYLIPLLKRLPAWLLTAASGLALLLTCVMIKWYFLANAAVALLLPAIGLSKGSFQKHKKLLMLRRMSIITFFVHFPIVTLIHVLYTTGCISYEYGCIPFILVYLPSTLLAWSVIRGSERWPMLKYLF